MSTTFTTSKINMTCRKLKKKTISQFTDQSKSLLATIIDGHVGGISQSTVHFAIFRSSTSRHTHTNKRRHIHLSSSPPILPGTFRCTFSGYRMLARVPPQSSFRIACACAVRCVRFGCSCSGLRSVAAHRCRTCIQVAAGPARPGPFAVSENDVRANRAGTTAPHDDDEIDRLGKGRPPNVCSAGARVLPTPAGKNN